MLDPDQFAFVGKTVLKLSASAIEEQTVPLASSGTEPLPDRPKSEPVQTAIAKLVEIVAELRSPMGGWPTELPKTAANLIPYVLEEAYDVLDAIPTAMPPPLIRGVEGIESSPEPATGNRQSATGNLSPGKKSIVVDDLLPRLLWNAVRSSYDVMQLIGGVPAQLGQPGNSPPTIGGGLNRQDGLVRLVVGLAFSSTELPWFVDLATHNVASDRSESDFCPEDALIHCPDITLGQKPIAAQDLLAQLRQQMALAAPELVEFMEPKPVECLHPNRQWLSGWLQLTMDLEFVPQADPSEIAQIDNETGNEATNTTAISEFADRDSTLLDSIVRLAQPSMLQDGAKKAIEPELICLRSQIQQVVPETENSDPATSSTTPILADDDTESPNSAISKIVSSAYDLVAGWEFPWGEGEVAIDEFLHRLLWQTITSSYPVMQSIGSVEAMVMIPGSDWEIGILRLLALFEIRTANASMTVDLSTGQPLEASEILDPKTIVRSPNTDFVRHPVMVEDLLNTLNQQIQTATPSFQWLSNGVQIDLGDRLGNWESGSGQFRLDFEFIKA